MERLIRLSECPLQIQANVWEQAIHIVDQWMLSPDDEEHDNQARNREGDGTSFNRALKLVRQRFVEELDKACTQVRREAQ